MPQTLPAPMNTHRPYACQMLFVGAGGLNPNGLVACFGPGQENRTCQIVNFLNLFNILDYFLSSQIKSTHPRKSLYREKTFTS